MGVGRFTHRPLQQPHPPTITRVWRSLSRAHARAEPLEEEDKEALRGDISIAEPDSGMATTAGRTRCVPARRSRRWRGSGRAVEREWGQGMHKHRMNGPEWTHRRCAGAWRCAKMLLIALGLYVFIFRRALAAALISRSRSRKVLKMPC